MPRIVHSNDFTRIGNVYMDESGSQRMSNKNLAWALGKAKDWKNYLPPARPSISELAVIEKFLVDRIRMHPERRFTVAILGCTIEFRDLVHKYGMEVTCIDVSDIHYRILSKQHQFYTGPEKFLAMDWRSMRSAVKYDFVLGDLVVNMLNTHDRALLLSNVRTLLAKGGVFISRSWLKIPGMPMNFSETVRLAHEKFPMVNFYTATAGYVYPAYSDDTEFTDVSRLKRALKDSRDAHEITPDEYLYWHNRLRYEIKGVSIPTMEDFHRQLSQHFEIVAMKEGIDIFADLFKIHFLHAIA